MSNEKQNFEIGQIIYLISEDTEAIIPAIVIEEQVVKKLDGSFVSWKIAIGPQNKRKEIDSNQLKGEMYTSLDEVRNVLTERLNAFVNNVVGDARKKTEAWYGKLVKETVKPNSEGGKIDPASLLSGLDSDDLPPSEERRSSRTELDQFAPGTVVTVSNKLNPNNNNGLIVNLDPTDPKSSLRKELLDRLSAEDEDEE